MAERLLTIREFAEATGASRATIWRWQRAGVIAGRKVGHRLVYTERDIETFNARHKSTSGGVPTDLTLNERAVFALETIAGAQVAQTLIGSSGQTDLQFAGLEIAYGLQNAASDLMRRLGIQQELSSIHDPVLEGTRI